MVEWDSLKFVVKFVIHIVVGAALFAVVACAAIYLHKFMDYVLADAGPRMEYISTAVEGVEILLFGADLICLVAFVVKESLVLLRVLWADAKTFKVGKA